MKKLILITLLAGIANASMCNFYYKRLVENTRVLKKANEEKMHEEIRKSLYFVRSYSKRTILNCEKGTRQYNRAKNLLKLIEKHYGK